MQAIARVCILITNLNSMILNFMFGFGHILHDVASNGNFLFSKFMLSLV